MRYFEDVKCFSYKVQDEEAGKPKWRVSVDMGLHGFMQTASAQYTSYLGYFIVSGNDELTYNRTLSIVEMAWNISKDLEGTSVITDDVFIKDFSADIKARAEELNRQDKETLYNPAWWEDRYLFLKEVKKKA